MFRQNSAGEGAKKHIYFLRLCLSFSLVSGGIESLPFFKVPLFIFERLGNILPDQNYFTGHMGTSRRLLSEEYLRIFPWGGTYIAFFLLSARNGSRGALQS